MFPCSKGHLVRAYLDTIQMTYILSRSQSIYISFSISGNFILMVFMTLITLPSSCPFQPRALNTNNIWLLNRKVEQLLKGMGKSTGWTVNDVVLKNQHLLPR